MIRPIHAGWLALAVALGLAVPASADCGDSGAGHGHGADSGYRLHVEQASHWDRDSGRGAILYHKRGRLRVSFDAYVGDARVDEATLYVDGRRAFRVDDSSRHRGGHYSAYEDKNGYPLGCVREAWIRIVLRGGHEVDYWIPPDRIRIRAGHCGAGAHARDRRDRPFRPW